jgi:hypothetical protein
METQKVKIRYRDLSEPLKLAVDLAYLVLGILLLMWIFG